ALYEDRSANGDLRRAFETAIAVCYGRPFASGNRAGSLGRRWQPTTADGRIVHEKLLDLRNQVFAHNDETDLRGVVDAGALVGLRSRWAEEWVPLNPEAMPRIIQVAREQQQRFRQRVDELQRSLDTEASG